MGRSSDYTISNDWVRPRALAKDISLKSNIDFESETIYRGIQRAGPSIQPTVEIGYPTFNFRTYAGLWSVMSYTETTYSDNIGEMNPYFGIFYEVTNLLIAD